MRRIAFWLCVAIVVLGFADVRRLAATSSVSGPLRASPVELLVFEHADCTFCRVFRRDVVPRYAEAPTAKKAPLRFLDVEHTDTTQLGLRGGIHVVPTFVLVENGREVDRIVGYWAPDNFFKMLSSMLARTSAQNQD